MRGLSPRLAAPAVLLTAAALGSASGGPPSPGAPAGEATYVKGADLALLQEVRDVALKVERIVGRRFGGVVAVRAGEPALVEAAARREASWGIGPRLGARGRAWADIGLGDERTPSVLLRLLASDLPGLALDPGSSRLLVSRDLMSPRDFEGGAEVEPATTVLLATGVRPDETLVAHALVHLLQSRREELSGRPETTDGLLARSAWEEGEAGLVAILYLFEGMGLGREVLEGRLDPGEVLAGRLLPDLERTPSRAGRTLLDFVYREGFFRAAEIALAGGMEALQGAARERPTTRDLLHPDRPPLRARWEGGEAAAGEAPPAMGLADRDEVGEQGIVVLVSTLTGKDNLALVAGDGWLGDALLRWEPEKAAPKASPSGLTAWVTRWATAKDAEEFEYAWRRCLEARFVGAQPFGEVEGSLTLEAGDRSFTWSRKAEEVRIRVTAKTGPAGSGPPPADSTPRRIPGKTSFP